MSRRLKNSIASLTALITLIFSYSNCSRSGFHVAELSFQLDSQSTGLKLSAYELASRLSYLIVNTTPDGPLLAAAANGSLLSNATFDAQLKRLLAMPAAKTS